MLDDATRTEHAARNEQFTDGQTDTFGNGSDTVEALLEADDVRMLTLLRRLEDDRDRRRRRRSGNGADTIEFDYDDIVEQSFPASDPPPSP